MPSPITATKGYIIYVRLRCNNINKKLLLVKEAGWFKKFWEDLLIDIVLELFQIDF